ncbi:hypothetical protein Tco_1261625 [Tanacetum coccineum]
MSSSTVTYTSVYSDFEPWRFQWAYDDEPKEPEEALPIPEQAPPSPNYVPGPEHPPTPDYVPGLEYPEYLVPSNDEVPIEDQPLPTDASPIALSPAYVAVFDPSGEDPEEDPEEDPAEYPADGGDDDDDDDDEEDEDEEEEHLALADSTTLPAIDLARISVRPQTPMAAAAKALIAAIPIPLLPLPSPPLLLPTPSSPFLLPATDRREDVPEADVPPQKRLCLNAPAPRFEVGESSTAAAARQPGLDVTHATDYVGDMEERAPTTLEELSQRVTDLAVTLARDTHEMSVRFDDAQDDRALQRARAIDYNRAVHAELLAYRAEVKALHGQISKIPAKRTITTTTLMTDVTIKALIAQGIVDALAEYEAHRSSGNGDDSHDSGSCRRTNLKCQPLNFKGTEGVVRLT